MKRGRLRIETPPFALGIDGEHLYLYSGLMKILSWFPKIS